MIGLFWTLCVDLVSVKTAQSHCPARAHLAMKPHTRLAAGKLFMSLHQLLNELDIDFAV